MSHRLAFVPDPLANWIQPQFTIVFLAQTSGLGMEPMNLCMLGKSSTIEQTPVSEEALGQKGSRKRVRLERKAQLWFTEAF